MTEKEFIKFYRERNNGKNSEEVKNKINLFWNVLLKALDEDKKVLFKGWGIFEKKEVKSRKAVMPNFEEAFYTKPKEVIKFRIGLGFKDFINENGDVNE